MEIVVFVFAICLSFSLQKLISLAKRSDPSYKEVRSWFGYLKLIFYFPFVFVFFSVKY